MSAPIADLGPALRRGATTAVDLTRAALRRIAERDPVLNAFVLVDGAGALAAAARADAELAAGRDRGPLHGVPVAVKDLVDVAGLPTTCGSASSFGTARAGTDAEIVTRLRAAGAVLVGKTTLHEFAYGATGDRSAHGPSRNPADPSRMSGGSSGGSAVAVADGMVPLAVGTDTAGSVRVPAALCGIAGFKPASGALPTGGVYPLAPTLDHVGLFATTARDVLLAYGVLAGEPRAAPGSAPSGGTGSATSGGTGDGTDSGASGGTGGGGAGPVGWIAPERADPRVVRAAHDALVRAGVRPEPVAPPWTGDLFATFSAVQGYEAAAVHRAHLPGEEPLVDPDVLARLRAGAAVTDAGYAAAGRARQEFRDAVLALLDRYPVLAMPTVPVVAPLLGTPAVDAGGTTMPTRTALLSLTSPWNLAGMPALSVPAGRVDGLPVGVQLVGDVLRPDGVALRIAG